MQANLNERTGAQCQVRALPLPVPVVEPGKAGNKLIKAPSPERCVRFRVHEPHLACALPLSSVFIMFPCYYTTHQYERIKLPSEGL